MSRSVIAIGVNITLCRLTSCVMRVVLPALVTHVLSLSAACVLVFSLRVVLFVFRVRTAFLVSLVGCLCY